MTRCQNELSGVINMGVTYLTKILGAPLWARVLFSKAISKSLVT